MSKNKANKETIEIDLKRIWDAVLSKMWLVILVPVICAALTLLGTIYLITPQYQSSAMFYVNNSSLSVGGDASLTIDSGDIVASKNLVDTYIVILNSRTCLNDVIDYADLKYTTDELEAMITASSVNSTEVFEVVITGPDPKEAEKIANAIAYVLPNKISDIVEGTSAKVVDYAIVSNTPSSPNRVNNTLLGFGIGLVSILAIVILAELFDTTIRSEADLTQISAHPVLTAVPDMMTSGKGGYYYGEGKKKSKKKKLLENESTKNVVLVGDGISFAAAEAYKLLRTKLEFSFADEKNCRIIGVSSALAGEGKSLSSVNLAYSLSQLGKKVLIIDCDMRRPSLAAKLDIQRVPGLSNYLAGRIGIEVILQTYGSENEDQLPVHVIAAGRVPPNPIELLSSEKMEQLLEKLRECYDYIVLDLPPVGEVSDAIVAAKLVDGILLVACQNYCNRNAFTHAVDQFEFVGARILGVVMNRVSEGGRGYYRYGKRYYKKYYKYGYQSSNPNE